MDLKLLQQYIEEITAVYVKTYRNDFIIGIMTFEWTPNKNKHDERYIVTLKGLSVTIKMMSTNRTIVAFDIKEFIRGDKIL